MSEGKSYLEVLSKHKHFYDFFIQNGELVNFSHDIQKEILTSYHEVDPYYHYNNCCPICVIEFLKTVYRHYENEKK